MSPVSLWQFIRFADTSSGFEGDNGERKFADGDRSVVVGSEASGSDPTAACVDGEEVEVLVGGNEVNVNLGFGTGSEGAVARGERE